MNGKLFKIVGVVGLTASLICLCYGAQMSVSEIAALTSKILGIIGSVLGGVLTLLGIKKDSNDKDDKE